jgi:hypothetical protein
MQSGGLFHVLGYARKISSVVALALFVLLACAQPASAIISPGLSPPDPTTTSAGATRTASDDDDDFGKQIKGILDILNGPNRGQPLSAATNSMAVMAVRLIKDSMVWSQAIHEALRGEAGDIAATLLWAVLFAEITFTGFRLMLGSSIIEQLGLLTTKTFIYVIVSGIVVFPGAPAPYNTAEGIIRSTMFRLMHAGKWMGMSLIKQSSHGNVKRLDGIQKMNLDPGTSIPGPIGWSTAGPPINSAPFSGQDAFDRPYRYLGGQGFGDAGSFGPNMSSGAGGDPSPAARAEPMMYWLSWLGVEFASEVQVGKLGQPWPTRKNSAGEDEIDMSKVREFLGPKEYKFSQLSLNVRIWGEDPTGGATVSQRLLKNAEAASDEFARQGGASGGKSSWEDTAAGVLVGTMPLQMFGIALSVAGVQIASLITVIFAQISMLVGSITAFNIAASLGLAVLPLMYFKTFDKIWSQYLIGLGSLALIPFLFYLMSAIGFILSTFIYEQLFPIPPSLGGTGKDTPSLAMILNQMFFSAVETTMSSFGLILSGYGKALSFLLTSMISIYITLGRIMFGCSIVAAFVSAGALFSLLAPRFAFRWQQAFGAEDVMEKMGEVFNNIQSSVGSGMGQMYSDAISKGGQMGKGAAAGLFGK